MMNSDLQFNLWWETKKGSFAEGALQNAFREIAKMGWDARMPTGKHLTNIRFRRGTVHADLRDGDELLIGATLEYILREISARGYLVEGVSIRPGVIASGMYAGEQTVVGD